MVPAEGRPKNLKLKSSWHRRRRSKILAVSLEHWKGRRGLLLLRCTAPPLILPNIPPRYGGGGGWAVHEYPPTSSIRWNKGVRNGWHDDCKLCVCARARACGRVCVCVRVCVAAMCLQPLLMASPGRNTNADCCWCVYMSRMRDERHAAEQVLLLLRQETVLTHISVQLPAANPRCRVRLHAEFAMGNVMPFPVDCGRPVLGTRGGLGGLRLCCSRPSATAHFPPPKYNRSRSFFPFFWTGGPDQNELAWPAHCMGLETTRNRDSGLSNSAMIPRMPSMRCCLPNTIGAAVSARRVFSTCVALMAGAFGVAHPPIRQ